MKKELLKACRYYKGGDICPYKEKHAMLWNIERAWYLDALATIERGEASDVDMEKMTNYINAGLANFCDTDDVPVTLKAAIFYKLADAHMSADGFKKFYAEYYTKKEV